MAMKKLLKHNLIRAAAVTLVIIMASFTCSFAALADDQSEIDEVGMNDAFDSSSGVDYSQATKSFTVKVGYFGGPYYVKTVFAVDGDEGKIYYQDGTAIDNDSYVTRTYSYVDSGEQVVIVSGYGVDLEELLDKAGIDLGSVQYIHLATTDKHVYSLSRTELAGRTRYYYSDLENYGILDEFEDIAEEIKANGQEVRPMLALQDNWQTEEMINHSLRLLFGQSSPTETEGEESAKVCHTCVVQLGGTPSLETSIEYDKVGSKYRVTVNLTTTDSNGHKTKMDDTIAQQIAAGLMITSTNRNALNVVGDPTVNSDGSYTFEVEAGEGTAELQIGTSSYGSGDNSGALEGTGAIKAEVSDGEAVFYDENNQVIDVAGNNDDTKTDPEKGGETPGGGGSEETPTEGGQETPSGGDGGQETSPQGGGSGTVKPADDPEKTEQESSGTSDADNVDNTEQNPSGSSSNTSIADDPNSDKNVQSMDETGESQTQSNDDADGEINENALTEGDTPTPENAEVVNSVLVQRMTIDSDEGGVQNWRDTDMAEDAVELGKQDTGSTLPYTGLVVLIVLLGGAGIHYLWYRRERTGKPDQ